MAEKLDPTSRPAPTLVGLATRDIKTGHFVQLGDIVSTEAIVQQTPQSQIRVVHSTIGTQANRARQQLDKNAWKNRR